jgi:hypothetical protein
MIPMSSTNRPDLAERIPDLMRRLPDRHAEAFASLLNEGEEDAQALCDRFEIFAEGSR